MKRILIIILIMGLLVGCSESIDTDEDEPVEEIVSEDEIEEEDEEQQELEEDEPQEEEEVLEEQVTDEVIEIDEAELKETITLNIGEDDQLEEFEVDDADIYIKVTLGEYIFEAKDMAVTRYSSITDGLLENEHWEKITVEFTDVGTITMNSEEAVDGEYGRYFDTLEIEGNLIP